MTDTFDVTNATNILREFNNHTAHFRSVDRDTLYKTIFVPKISGGQRRIDIPSQELKDALWKLQEIFERHFFILDILKSQPITVRERFLDKNFRNYLFRSSTEASVMDSLSRIWPFSSVIADDEGREQLSTALDLCFLNGSVPLGSPSYALIVNLMAINFGNE